MYIRKNCFLFVEMKRVQNSICEVKFCEVMFDTHFMLLCSGDKNFLNASRKGKGFLGLFDENITREIGFKM